MSTKNTSRSRRRAVLVYAALGMGAIALLGACSDESGDSLLEDVELPDVSLPEGTLPDAELPDAELPDAELPDAELPDAELPDVEIPDAAAPEEPEEPAEDEGLTTGEWVLLGLLGIVVIAIVVGATGAATRRSQKKDAARASLNDRLARITGATRWVLDQASVEVLRISDPQQLRTSRTGTRTRIIDLESDIAVLNGSTGDSGLDRSLSVLGQNVAGLRGSLDTLVTLRTSDAAAEQQALIDDASRTVQERRQQLSAAVAPVQAAQR